MNPETVLLVDGPAVGKLVAFDRAEHVVAVLDPELAQLFRTGADAHTYSMLDAIKYLTYRRHRFQVGDQMLVVGICNDLGYGTDAILRAVQEALGFLYSLHRTFLLAYRSAYSFTAP